MGEVHLANLCRFGFRPFIKAHLVDQAQIENLDIVGEFNGFIRIGVQVVAWKIFTISAQVMPLALSALVGGTAMRLSKKVHLERYPSVVDAATLALHDFQGDIVFP
jgi:hypothetical protein